MDKKEEPSIAIVTGASRGIGRATAIKLASAGYYTIINYRSNKNAAQETLDIIKSAGGNGEISEFDVRDSDKTSKALEDILSRFSKIEILVNNAGINADGLFIMMPEKDWRSVIDTALNGFYNVTKPVLSAMVKQKCGAIVSVSSASALVGNRGQANYAAAKAGLIGATRAIASEVARLGIRVNIVAPGLIETEMIENVPKEKIKAMIPMARIGRTEEVANVIYFLCSDAASYITGQVISVNGGMF